MKLYMKNVIGLLVCLCYNDTFLEVEIYIEVYSVGGLT
jgi:hypothetical protein